MDSCNDKIALMVGIDDYPGHELSSCVRDIKEMEDLLGWTEYGFKINTLIDGEATKSAIKKAINELLDKKPKLMLFYFSGHGLKTSDGCYLLTHDWEKYDPGVSFNYLQRIIEKNALKKPPFYAYWIAAILVRLIYRKAWKTDPVC